MSAVKDALLRNRNPDEYGFWVIRGEDPNADYGSGYHHQPILDYVTGYYKFVVEYAWDLPQFTTWGGGGSITKETVTPVGPAEGEFYA